MNAESGSSSEFPRLQRLRNSLDTRIQERLRSWDWIVSAAGKASFFKGLGKWNDQA